MLIPRIITEGSSILKGGDGVVMYLSFLPHPHYEYYFTPYLNILNTIQSSYPYILIFRTQLIYKLFK